MKELELGKIELGEKVRVSDPCYDMGVWCAGTVENVLAGEYVCTAEIMPHELTNWGDRVSSITVVHKDYVNNNLEWEGTGFEVGVDSGQAGIYDLEYFEKSQPDDDYQVDDSLSAEEQPTWYSKVCKATDDFAKTLDGKCLVSRSGFGDGGYDCLVTKNEDGKVVAISITYIWEDDLDDEEDEEEY